MKVIVGIVVVTALATTGCRYNPAEMADSLMRQRVDALVDSLESASPGATMAVYVSDASSGWTYSRSADRVFHAASTMKVPVMIELFRLDAAGRLSLDDELSVKNDFRSIVDGSPYAMSITEDSDDAIYSRIGETMPIRDLIFQMITVSSNLATNILIDHVGADSVQATINRMGVTTMRVLRGVEDIKAYEAGLSNTATAADLGVLMEHIAARTAVSPEADELMIDILEAQAFNEMIPDGLPAGVRVAHKTGSITRINHDAAIVSADQDPYVLVILTEGIDDHAESARMGARVAKRIHETIRPNRR